jgi:hypothetical protein
MWIVTLAAAGSCLSLAHSTRKAPNILFFLADDLGYGDVSPMPGGSNRTQPRLLTPNMARLADSLRCSVQHLTEPSN